MGLEKLTHRSNRNNNCSNNNNNNNIVMSWHTKKPTFKRQHHDNLLDLERSRRVTFSLTNCARKERHAWTDYVEVEHSIMIECWEINNWDTLKPTLELTLLLATTEQPIRGNDALLTHTKREQSGWWDKTWLKVTHLHDVWLFVWRNRVQQEVVTTTTTTTTTPTINFVFSTNIPSSNLNIPYVYVFESRRRDDMINKRWK